MIFATPRRRWVRSTSGQTRFTLNLKDDSRAIAAYFLRPLLAIVSGQETDKPKFQVDENIDWRTSQIPSPHQEPTV